MSHTNANPEVTTGNAYFDLFSYIQGIQCPDVAAQAAQSAAWEIDRAIQTAVRSLMQSLRRHHELHGVDSINAMTIEMRSSAFTEEVIRMAGKDDLGPVASFVQLTHLRERAQQLAADLTSMTYDWQGIPRSYDIKPMEELLNREFTLDVAPKTIARIRTSVQRRADDASQEDIDMVVGKRIKREEERAADRTQALMSQRQTLVTLYHVLVDLADSGELAELDILPEGYGAVEVEFHDLDTSLQRSMILGALRGAERAEDYATNSSSITDAEYDAVSFGVIRVERELKAVLQSPKFLVQERRDSAGRAVPV